VDVRCKTGGVPPGRAHGAPSFPPPKGGWEMIRCIPIVTDVLETALFARKRAVWRTLVTIGRHRIVSDQSLAPSTGAASHKSAGGAQDRAS
jgi:hypothetical protein